MQSFRTNPYAETDAQGYLVNPEASKYQDPTHWYHFSNHSFDEFKPIEGREVTFFGGDYGDFEHTIILNWRGRDLGTLYVVKIRPLRDALILTREDLFEPVPHEIKYILLQEILEDGLELEDQFYSDSFIPSERDAEVLRYFSTFSCMRKDFRELLASMNTNADAELISSFLISLYCMTYRAVQALFFDVSYSAEHFGINTSITKHLSDLGFYGWFEKERLEAGLNIGIDLRHFDVEIVSKEQFDPQSGWRNNPWLRNQLYFRYGFWDLEPNANMMYHVTPKLSAILESTELSSRASRDSKVEGLGGSHDVSVSYYGSLNRAAFTLMYLYRIWQVKEGILTLHDLAEIANWNDEQVRIASNRYSSKELVGLVRMSLGAPDPIVFGDSWADGLTKDDFAILCFKNPCKHMFVQDLLKLSRRSDDTTIKALTQDSIQELRRIVHPFSYFGSYPDNLLWIYGDVRKRIENGETEYTYENGKIEDREFRKKIMGSSSWYPEKEWNWEKVIEFENITIDLRKQPVKIEDLCIYLQGEQEFQLFRSMPMSDLWEMYTIHDILREAKERNGGVEPFFWDMNYAIDGLYPWSAFQLATWVDEK